MKRTPNGYLVPCPFCSEDTIYDGKRRYWPEGFPYVHECMTKKLPPITEPTRKAPEVTRIVNDKGLPL